MTEYWLYPERYQTTFLRDTFPEMHWPLAHQRQRLGHVIHDLIHPFEEDVRTPHTDIRETAEKYYIDVELAGLVAKEDYSLKWTNSRTLLVQAQIKRPQLPEEVAAASLPERTPGFDVEPRKFHFLARERGIGTFARAFYFNVDVDHDRIEAQLQAGLLRLVLLKKEPEHMLAKDVEVKHVDS
ncbi:hypothetical protein BX600DRAFT_441721 [Xylariales sp. PMI_506]|nr:hypothetical protein BX600DRAFT_441721 [Xylariales sp. PMI_506]